MGISPKDIKLLWGASGNRCAICHAQLSHQSSSGGTGFPLGEQAHIVAEEPSGPRGNSPLGIAERNSYHNLILLCPNDHALIDRDLAAYPVERLYFIKSKHELWVQQTLGREKARNNPEAIALSDLLVFIELAKPFFALLYKPISEQAAQAFFAAAQRFWTYRNLATDKVDDRLRQAMDYLIRPLAADKFTLFENLHYATSKIYIAHSLFSDYFANKDRMMVEPEKGDTLYNLVIQLAMSCEVILHYQEELDDLEVALVRCLQHTAHYYEGYLNAKRYTAVPEELFKQYIQIIELFLTTKLDVQIPDVLDASRLDKIYMACAGKLFSHSFNRSQ